MSRRRVDELMPTKPTEMTKRTTYHARFTLEEDAWLAEIVEIPEVHTFGRTLGKAREYIVDALALWLDESIDAVRTWIEFEIPDLPEPIRQAAQLAVGARALSECVSNEAADLMTAGASALVVDAHLSIRDAAEILGLSHQRVHQILPNADKAVAAAAEIRERADVFGQFLVQNGSPNPSFKPVDRDDVLKMIAVLLIGGAIGTLIANS
jgi:predicted RNase H-like HicB family nuclease